MRIVWVAGFVFLLMGCPFGYAQEKIPNPHIDYEGFRTIVVSSGGEREERRLTEAQFLKAMQEEGVVLLDARSVAKYHLRHLRGAVNLPFTEFTADTLPALFPIKIRRY